MAFSASFAVLGPMDEFAIAGSALFGVLPIEAPRWISWALGDLVVKFAVALAMLLPYGILQRKMARPVS